MFTGCNVGADVRIGAELMLTFCLDLKHFVIIDFTVMQCQ